MKLKQRFFNLTAFRWNLTRFAPAWVLYTVFLVLMMTMVMGGQDYDQADNMKNAISVMAAVNLIYGALNAQLLFGDLFQSRLCNALHAMPLKRECWFSTAVCAGMLFSLVPNGLVSALMAPVLGTGAEMALWWFLAVGLQYIFFFGVGVLSMLCVGNRFAMVLVYGILNFLSQVIYWLILEIYQPLLYGVSVGEGPFTLLAPIYTMTSNLELVEIVKREVDDGIRVYYEIQDILPAGGWLYLGACAGAGVICGGIGLWMYRKRHLECAGDFMAVSFLEPVFQVLYTACAGAFFQIFGGVFGGAGLVVGFFTGQMLLKRQIRVFRLKTFLAFGVLMGAFALSLFLTKVDVLGVTRYIPAVEDVKQVALQGSATGSSLLLQTPEDILRVTQIHEDALKNRPGDMVAAVTAPEPKDEQEEVRTVWIELCYQLKSGRTVTRKYQIATTSQAGQITKDYFTTLECVLGITEADIPDFASRISYFHVSDQGENMPKLEEFDLVGLLQAVAADCRDGTMVQDSRFHPGNTQWVWLELEFRDENRGTQYRNIKIAEDAVHTVRWLDDRGLYIQPEQDGK